MLDIFEHLQTNATRKAGLSINKINLQHKKII
jgi:hypothetical protein